MGVMKEFKEFAVKRNVADMAVRVIVGGMFGKIIPSFLGDVMMPRIRLLSGGVDFSDVVRAVNVPSTSRSQEVWLTEIVRY